MVLLMKKSLICIVAVLLLVTSLSIGNIALAVKEFDIDGITKSIENDPGFVNDYDPRIVYTGPWSKNQFTPAGGIASNGGRDWTALYAGGGRAYLGEVRGATVEFTFIGTSIMVLMTRYTDLGSVEFTLDNQAPVKVDLTCAAGQSDDNYAAFKKTGLSSGVHTIKLKNVDAPGKDGKEPAPGWIHLIGFVTDNGIVNSSNTKFVKESGFELKTDAEPNQNATCCIGDDLSLTSQKGSTMTFEFEGSYVGMLSKVGKGYGTADIAIDGKPAGTVNLESSKTIIQKMVFAKGGLSSGKHTLTVTTKEAKPFSVDAFIVQKSMASSTTTTRPKASLNTTGATKKPSGNSSSLIPDNGKTDKTQNGLTTQNVSGSTENTDSMITGESELNTTASGQNQAVATTAVQAMPKKSSNTAVTIVIVVMIVLLLGLGSIAAYLLYFKPKNNANKPQ